MNNNGFGFSFNFGGNDDDRDKSNSGGLGDMLNQLGNMLSGMGNSMNSEDGPVNYSLAQRIARQEISTQQRQHPAQPQPDDAQRAAAAVNLVELWLDEHTILPASNNSVATWNAEQWLEETLPVWKRLINPIAENMAEAQLASIPEEARDAMGPMINMMNQMSSMNFGMNAGHALGDLASQTISGTDFGLPLAPQGVTALLLENLRRETQDLPVKEDDMLYFLAACEAARQRLFNHVPWLREQLISSIEEYAAGLVIDTSHIEEAMRELNLDNADPAAIQEAMSQLQNSDLSPRITSRNLQAASRLETLLALIEGWVSFVVHEALSGRMPQVAALESAWHNRQSSGGSADKVFATLAGLELNTPPVDQARELWRRVTVAVGSERRDHVWDHPDFLPGADDVANSAEFIDSLLDTSDSDFDPIAEINKLEEMLKEQSLDPEAQENPTADDADAGDADANDAGDAGEDASEEDK